MNILLVRTLKGLKYAAKISRQINKRGIPCHITDVPSLTKTLKEKSLKPSNTLVHCRTAGPKIVKIMAKLEHRGYKVVNSSKTLELTNNKYLSQTHSSKNRIPHAETYKVKKNNFKLIRKILDKLKVVVIKPVYSQGQGVFCNKVSSGISDADLAKIVGSTPGSEIQLQKFVDYGKLIRVIVLDFKAVKNAMTFDEPNEGWKCSVCLNPKIKHYSNPSAVLVKLAEKTARAFDARVNFIDFFEDKNGEFILNEINTACSLLIHERITGVKICGLIADTLVKTVKKEFSKTS